RRSFDLVCVCVRVRVCVCVCYRELLSLPRYGCSLCPYLEVARQAATTVCGSRMCVCVCGGVCCCVVVSVCVCVWGALAGFLSLYKPYKHSLSLAYRPHLHTHTHTHIYTHTHTHTHIYIHKCTHTMTDATHTQSSALWLTLCYPTDIH